MKYKISRLLQCCSRRDIYKGEDKYYISLWYIFSMTTFLGNIQKYFEKKTRVLYNGLERVSWLEAFCNFQYHKDK